MGFIFRHVVHFVLLYIKISFFFLVDNKDREIIVKGTSDVLPSQEKIL